MFRAVLDANTPRRSCSASSPRSGRWSRSSTTRRSPGRCGSTTGAGVGDATPMRIPVALNAAHRHLRGGRGGGRRVPAALRPASASSHRRRLSRTGRPGAAALAIAERIHRERADPVRHLRRGRAVRRRAGSSPGRRRRPRRRATSSPAPRSARCSARCVARALDDWWHELRRPGPVRGGGGRGRARAGSRATCCGPSPSARAALRYVLVERSPALRAAQRELLTVEPFEDALGPSMRGRRRRAATGRGHRPDRHRARRAARAARSTASCSPTSCSTTSRSTSSSARRDGWAEVRVGASTATRSSRCRCRRPTSSRPRLARRRRSAVPVGARLPVADAASGLDRACAARCATACSSSSTTPPSRRRAGRARHRGGWLRTYRGHGAAAPTRSPRPATQDITIDVPVEYLCTRPRPGRVPARARARTQAEWLARARDRRPRRRGAATRGRPAPTSATSRPSAGRSRVTEAAALTDPAGLGAHRVLVLHRR